MSPPLSVRLINLVVLSTFFVPSSLIFMFLLNLLLRLYSCLLLSVFVKCLPTSLSKYHLFIYCICWLKPWLSLVHLFGGICCFMYTSMYINAHNNIKARPHLARKASAARPWRNGPRATSYLWPITMQISLESISSERVFILRSRLLACRRWEGN